MDQDEEAKRATTMLTIAQLKLKQALRKEDAEARLPPVSTEISSHFFSDLDAVLKQNTRVNVQKCTDWIVKHIASSKARIAGLGDFLTAVSRSIMIGESPGRNRIDLLLIVNDVLHTDKFHRRSTTKQAIFGSECAGAIAVLVEQAAACMPDKGTHAEQKLRAILNYWAVNQLLSAEHLKECRDRAEESLLVAQGGTSVRKRNYLLPEYHGDRTAPWHDLPASYMLEQMIKHPQRAIDPSRFRVQKLDKKPVTPHVRKLLDDYFENIDLKYLPTGDNPSGETNKLKLSLDYMGHVVKQVKETGDTSTVCTGYGWSPKFCQDMQKHGMPENIRIAREDVSRLEDSPEPQHNSYALRSGDGSGSRPSSPDDSYNRRERTRRRPSHSYSRRGSESSYDSRPSYSLSRSRDRSRDQRRSSPRREARGPDDRGQGYNERASDQPRPPPRSYGRDSAHSGSQWNGSNSTDRSARGSYQNNSYPVPSYNAPQFPSQPPAHGQFGSQFQTPPFVPPPPPLQFQGPGNFVPPPPPNYNGPWHPPPPPPNMSSSSNMSHNFGNQHGPQYGNQFGNNFAHGNNLPHGQNQGGFAGGRGGYRGGFSRGTSSGNRGYGGAQRGQRGGRY